MATIGGTLALLGVLLVLGVGMALVGDVLGLAWGWLTREVAR